MHSCVVLLCFCVLVLSGVLVEAADSLNNDLVNKNVHRSIDISSQLVRISHKITLENTGKSGVKSFMFTTEQQFAKKLCFISAQTGDSGKTSLKVVPTTVGGRGNEPFWRIDLADTLQPGKSVVVDVDTVSSKLLTPLPAAISQKEKQLVIYEGSHYFYSPYFTAKQSALVALPSRNVESYSKLKPTSQSDASITYGPYEKVPAFTVDRMSIHYENNSPFVTITNLDRTIEVSHWGNIAVEETIDVEHTGAILKGPFSRYEYQRESQSGVSSVKAIKTILPAAATDVYYRDEIGNISTSNMRVLSDSVELDLRPRFPLFGGWKTHYVIGYNLPSYEYLFNSRDDYLLKMRLVDHVFDDMYAEVVTTRVILPEGSHDIQLATPYPVERLPDTLHFTYLDTKGRPVVTLRKTNVVESHIQDFELQYNFPRILMLQEPLLVVIAFYLLFLLVIIYVRLDFSITKDEGVESKLRVSGYVEKLMAHQDKRALTYSRFDDLLAKLKTSKDVSAFQSAMKSINADYKAEMGHIADLLVKLKADAPDVAEKVSELQKLDKQLKELCTQQQTVYVEKLVPGKINRQQFLDLEATQGKKREECVDKINALLKSLH
ncbi:dolichyl-diphosphooligosaccharide--protein glycosyltransferase subunit 1 [Bacillus rossius redtenbacheri]|uniref:dolichyl-diphosphooligosaccharide--protein glycosyltransferase subunit 1 n=1 Tax=Bacillus rossius redtenbacheri TaxID=93214 RepID=UPI002FDE20D7